MRKMRLFTLQTYEVCFSKAHYSYGLLLRDLYFIILTVNFYVKHYYNYGCYKHRKQYTATRVHCGLDNNYNYYILDVNAVHS